MYTKILYLASAFVIFYLGYMSGSSSGTQDTLLHAAIKKTGPKEYNYNIEDYINTLKESAVTTTQKGYQYWYVPKSMSNGKLNLKLSQVKAMEANHAPHQHPEEEIFLLIEGEAEFYLDGESRKVEANSSMYCPPNVMHGIRNTGKTPMKYLVIKTR
ncbi:MAG: cupin domain-containing protein [Cyclobacteriaceae bacterium]|nr:cupin domain-containing protein [Cyclobacteriaceae bacterium]